MKEPTNLSAGFQTTYISIDTGWCRACWTCINVCPSRIIDKEGSWGRGHIVIRNSENCTGCKKCVKICGRGVFSENKRI